MRNNRLSKKLGFPGNFEEDSGSQGQCTEDYKPGVGVEETLA